MDALRNALMKKLQEADDDKVMQVNEVLSDGDSDGLQMEKENEVEIEMAPDREEDDVSMEQGSAFNPLGEAHALIKQKLGGLGKPKAKKSVAEVLAEGADDRNNTSLGQRAAKKAKEELKKQK